MMLAMTIDDSFINWLIGGAAVCLPAIGTTIVLLWRKLIAFIQPKIENVFKSHTELVDKMTANVPVVADTMKSMAATLEKLGDTQEKIGQTQDKQADTLELHTKKLESQHEVIQTILSEVRKGDGK